jgi:hypothetical protein
MCRLNANEREREKFFGVKAIKEISLLNFLPFFYLKSLKMTKKDESGRDDSKIKNFHIKNL